MLKEIIREQIARDGYITIPDYMTLCLLHPQYGYYTTQQVFGSEGDFTTAPEISQLFGEMIGVWAVLEWERLGQPEDFNLVELGPGRGTLMQDLLRATRQIQKFHAGLNLHFVEASAQLRNKQDEVIAPFHAKVSWHDTIADLQLKKPTIIIANEFFDALPIRQFIAVDKTWRERVIVIDGDRFAWSTIGVDRTLHLPDAAALDDGTIYEQSQVTQDIFSDLCSRLKHTMGAMVVIDYGDYMEPRFGDTLQSMRQHKFVDVLEAWDKADITSHIDFYALEKLARQQDLKTAFVMQLEFLHHYGIEQRVERLCANQSIDTQAVIRAGYDRLMEAGQMGQLFKVLVVQTP